MKKRQHPAAKSRKTRQKHVPTDRATIHEWNRRLLQAGYILPSEIKHPAQKPIAYAALTCIAAIIALIYLAVATATPDPLYSNIPAEWHAQTSQTAHK